MLKLTLETGVREKLKTLIFFSHHENVKDSFLRSYVFKWSALSESFILIWIFDMFTKVVHELWKGDFSFFGITNYFATLPVSYRGELNKKFSRGIRKKFILGLVGVVVAQEKQSGWSSTETFSCFVDCQEILFYKLKKFIRAFDQKLELRSFINLIIANEIPFRHHH